MPTTVLLKRVRDADDIPLQRCTHHADYSATETDYQNQVAHTGHAATETAYSCTHHADYSATETCSKFKDILSKYIVAHTSPSLLQLKRQEI